MRLLKIGSDGNISLTEDFLDNIPPYGILSHTWGADHDECTFDDLRDGLGKRKTGYAKIQFCAQEARKDRLEYFWVDSCCINKANHAELSEAINSMFRWYLWAQKCYVYLSDVSAHKRDHDGQTQRMWEPAFRTSRWFTRGWTLQELLAPESVEFFSREGELLGSKRTLDGLIQEITQIPIAALQGAPLPTFTVDERMRWAAKRSTKRIEDKVYCLLGIFDVHMVPIYGEGEHAWVRLKDEIGRSYRSQLDEIGQSFIAPNSCDLQGQTTDRRRELLTSLSFDQMDSRRSTIKSAYSTTCEWFLKHPAYVTWIDPNRLHEHHGILWINGKPGAGKSTLVKFAHAYTDRARPDDEIVVSFFFNARGDELEKSTIGMYRALLFQLLKKAEDLQDVLDDFHPSSPPWKVESLRELLSLAIARLRKRRLKCFIDALDECDEQQIQEMVVFFEELGQSAVDGGSQVYVCFASRHYPTIDIRSGRQLTLENECGHGEDLAKYVQSHLRAGKGGYVEEIRTHIREKANGVFLWAVLVVDILNKEFLHGRIFAVKTRLQEIPAKLGDLFKDILNRDRANMSDFLLCLQWILFAKRSLRREEFYFAMVAGLDPEPQNMGHWDPEHITIEDINRFVLSSSKGLAECTKSKIPTVQFIHESVRDFLIKDNGLCELWPEIGKRLYSSSHDKLKRCCQNYLRVNSTLYDSADQTLETATSAAAKELRQRLSSELPFLEYASRHVLYHADEAATEIPQSSFLEELDLESLLKVTNLFERYDIRRHTLDASLLYVLAENNFAQLIRTLSRKGLALNVYGERYQYPLFAALANGHRDAVQALLQPDKNALTEDITKHLQFGRAFLPPKGQMPLFWALEKGHEAIAEMLVANEVEASSRDGIGQKALSLGAEKGFKRVVSLLLTLPFVSVDAYDNIFYRTPLSYAAKQGHTAVVQLLLEHDANVNIPDRRDHRTPLSHAAEQGHTAVVQLLLEHDANVYISDLRYYRTALSYAAQHGNTAVIQLLLELGSNIDVEDNTGRMALSWAAQSKEATAMQLLLKSGAYIDARDNNGRTALFSAAQSGDAIAAELLLKQGADIEATDNNGKTALLWAAARGEDSVVQLLLEQGADIEATDIDGETALLWAVQNGHELVVRLLLERSASIEAIDKAGKTPLVLAAHAGRRKMVEVLVAKGANMEAQDKDGRTPLSYASENGDEGAVLLLVASNASVLTEDRTGKTALLWAMERSGQYYERGPTREVHSRIHALQDYQMQLMLLEQQNKKRRLMARQGEVGSSPQREELSNNRAEIIRLLLDNGARLDARESNGKTALMLASENRWDNAVRLQQKYSAETGIFPVDFLRMPS